MVRHRAFLKEIVREVIRTRGRFLGIMAIVALGVAFYAGIGATGDDMKQTGDLYFAGQNLMDIRVVGTYGLNARDIAAIRSVPGVADVCPSYSLDAQTQLNGSALNIKVHAYDVGASVNKPVLEQGRLPSAAAECLAEPRLLQWLHAGIGDRITLSSGKDADIRNRLRNRTFTISGVVQSPLYVSEERGASSIGRGETDLYIYIPKENFLTDVYTEAYVRAAATEGLSSFSDLYADTVDGLTERIEHAGEERAHERAREMTAAAFARLRESERGLMENETQTLRALDENARSIAEARNAMPMAYTEALAGLSETFAQMTGLETQISSVSSGLADMRTAEAELDTQERELRDTRRGVMETAPYLGAAYADTLREVDAGLAEIAEARYRLVQTKQSLYTRFRELSEARAQVMRASAGVYNNIRPLTAAARSALLQETELAARRAALLDQFSAASGDLHAARTALYGLDDPEWYVLDREANPGYVSYADDTDKIKAIGQVFPLIFFLVAALVCLTSMTRLVEERRMEIGTLKALGYSGVRIMSKYILYAVLPTLAGGIAGGIIGQQLFPSIIIAAYGMMYSLPSPVTPFRVEPMAFGLLMGLASTGLSALFACVHTLRENPSGLLRPKAPKTGKRTVFERITFFWRRLNFIQKVTVRNLFRYKKRLLMTVIGISGCTALILTGFGIRDAISGIAGLQYGELNRYDMTVSFTDSATDRDIENAEEMLAASPSLQNALRSRQKNMDVSSAKGGTYQAAVIVPRHAEETGRFFNLRDRATHTPVDLSDSGVVISEKLSRLLAVVPGGTLVLRDGDGEPVSVPVTGITEMYFLHYVYMTPAFYAQAFGAEPEYNTVFAVTDGNVEATDMLAAQLLEAQGVSGVSFVRDMMEQFDNILRNMDLVVFILIASAGALALVVLINLTGINISERVRELATLEVLGLYDMEMALYVYRENIVLTAMGALAGLGLGFGLHRYIIVTIETEAMMFGREIRLMSYFWSLLITFAFALAANLLTARRLRKISMVEALKSTE